MVSVCFFGGLVSRSAGLRVEQDSTSGISGLDPCGQHRKRVLCLYTSSVIYRHWLVVGIIGLSMSLNGSVKC